MAETKESEDEALNTCLVKFVNTFSGELTTGPCKSLADLSNGVMLFELLSLLAPAHFDMDDITKETGNAVS